MKIKFTKEENLKRMMENVLFNKQNLEELKELINNLRIGKTLTRDLKEFILLFREEALNELLQMFKFYAKQMTTKEQLSEFTSKKKNHEIEELQQKNELLTIVASKVESIYEKIKENIKLIE
ncbi:MAG: hypothetical protein ACFFC3_03715 [Candidatus Odinarchaeota archaeon]